MFEAGQPAASALLAGDLQDRSVWEVLSLAAGAAQLPLHIRGKRAAWFLLGFRAGSYMTTQPHLQLAASKVLAGAGPLQLPPVAFCMDLSSCCRASSFWTTRSMDHLSAGCCSQHPRMTSVMAAGHRSGSVGRHPSATCSKGTGLTTVDYGKPEAADCRQH